MAARLSDRISFDRIRYANCWEDADVLLAALSVKRGGCYLSVASAGDNTFSIASRAPSLILTVDLSPAQIACVEIRKAAFGVLSYHDLLAFLGIEPCRDRLSIYREVRPLLSPTSRSCWDERLDQVRHGVIHAGRFERYFATFRRYALPLAHSKRTVAALLEQRPQKREAEFYWRRWNTWRWRTLFRVFFSRFIMGLLGRSPEFFTYASGPLALQVAHLAEHGLTRVPVHNNPYLRYIMTGSFRGCLPHYLRRENYEAIRANLECLVLFGGDVLDALDAHPSLRFDGFNLSDIFEYMSPGEYTTALSRIVDRAAKGARLVYWNLLADRKAGARMSHLVRPLDELARELFLKNRAFFYKALVVEESL